MFFKQFGGSPTKELKERYAQSPNWKDGRFQNFLETSLAMNFTQMPGIIYKALTLKENREPKQPLPILPFDKEAFLAPSDSMKFIWYGHSVVLLRIQGKTLLIDPMLGPDTTPITPTKTKRFSEGTLDLIDEFPEIDAILITHDHYDHLDFASIQKLKGKTKRFFTSLGVGRHLESWGVPSSTIREFDWFDDYDFEGIKITFTPTRHFSGRGLTDRYKSLWGGWAFRTQNENIWFSGDGGYGPHFKEVGERLGPFDFAFMECGQYNDEWRPIHLFPEESVQAALDACVKTAMPVHWAGFNLSFQHTWWEPAEDFVKNCQAKELSYALPRIGELSGLGTFSADAWWGDYS